MSNMQVVAEISSNLCAIKFNDNPSLKEHIVIHHADWLPEIKAEAKEVKEDNVKLKYVLDELKNMKVAKSNAKRPMESKKIEVNDTNVRFELNSALYLVTKEELMELVPGQSSMHEGTKVDIESKTHHIDEGQNNPASVIKVKVTDVKSGFESKVTINLYHSNQGIHIQGGRRNGNITSCTLLGNFLETFFAATLKKQAKRVGDMREILIKWDLRKNYNKGHAATKGSKIVKEMKTLLCCSKCHYRSMLQTEMKRHMFKLHRQDILTVVGEIKNNQTHLSVVQAAQPAEEPANREQAARYQMASVQEARVQPAMAQAAREKAARDQTVRDQGKKIKGI